ncbi:MAG: hypothetical protein J5944_09315 [Lentisphaeria bacterium]|nr:hypothetical protein [Lentisphaeria bacterium]
MSAFRRFCAVGIVFLLTASVSLCAFDLTLKSGELLSGVSIAGVSPDGLQLRSPEGSTRFVRFDALSPASMKLLSDFSPVSNGNPGGKRNTGGNDDGPPVVLPGMIGIVYFRSVRILQGGTLGWAESAESGTGAAPTQFGKVYIYGLFIPQGNVWTGRAYPTPVRIPHRGESYPCWALSPSEARRIALSEE